MEMLKSLNNAMEYLEDHLCAEWDPGKVAEIACVSADSFLRFFSYMTGITLSEYIRRRKLTLAAFDLQNTKEPIVDIAVRYGWDSAAAFSRAFIRQHGIAPSVFRKRGGALKIFPPASFHITIKGAKEMDFRIVELKNTPLFGIALPYEGMGYETHEDLRNRMWSAAYEDVPLKICNGVWDNPDDTQMDGIWYGVWQGERSYMIAREKANCINDPLESLTLPGGTYAVFRTGKGGNAWEEFPRLRDLIFNGWLPTSGYRAKSDLLIEVLHLWVEREKRRKERYYEIYLPIEKA